MKSTPHFLCIYPKRSDGVADSLFLIMIQKLYKSPEVEIIETHTEGILCASNGDLELDMNPEDGNM